MIECLIVAGAPTPRAPFSPAVAADGWASVTGLARGAPVEIDLLAKR